MRAAVATIPAVISTARPIRRLAGAIGLTLALAPPVLAQPATGEREPGPGEVVVVAGIGEYGYSGDGGDARDARLGDYLRVAVGPDGTVHLADRTNGRLRTVTDGIIDTVPGTVVPRPGITDLGVDNPPLAVAIAPDGTRYVATHGGILRGGEDGRFTVVAGDGDLSYRDGGTGGDGGPAARARISTPGDLAIDGEGNLYVADVHNGRVRRIDRDGIITTIAGGGREYPSREITATLAALTKPSLLAVDSTGSVHVVPDDGRWVQKISPDGMLSTVATFSGGLSGDGGHVRDAQGGRVGGIAVDAEDNLYVTDIDHGQVRRITPKGIITTVTPTLRGDDIAVGPDGDLYVTGRNQVHRLVRHGTPPATSGQDGGTSPWVDEAPGTVHVVAGNGEQRDANAREHLTVTTPRVDGLAAGPDGTIHYTDAVHHELGQVAPDGTVTVVTSQLEQPRGLAVGEDGVHVADHGNNRLRLIAQDGTGSPVGGNGMGPPWGVAIDPSGELVVTTRDSRGEGEGLVQRLDADAVPHTVAGGGQRRGAEGDGHPATESDLSRLGPVAVGPDGSVYFAEGRFAAVRRVGRDGILTTVVGDSARSDKEAGFAGDGGPATEAQVNAPSGLAVTPDGTLYIADTYNNRVRMVDRKGVITTIAGTGARADDGDGRPATRAAVLEPTAVTVDRDGNVHVATSGGLLRRISAADGTIDTLADLRAAKDESGDGGPATEAVVPFPLSLAVGPDSTLHVADQHGVVRAVAPDGTISTLDRMARALATDRDGSLYLDTVGDPDAPGVWRRRPDGAESVVASGRGPFQEPNLDGRPATATMLRTSALATGPDGELHLVGQHFLYRLGEDGRLQALVRGQFAGADVDRDGVVYLADSVNDRVMRVTGTTATVFAGNGSRGDDEGDGGPATDAPLRSPSDVAVADDGTVYISTGEGIRRVDPDGTIDTLDLPLWTLGGPEPWNPPGALAVGPGGDLYFAQPESHRVLVVVRPGEMGGSFPWLAVGLGAGAVVAAGAVTLAVRGRRR